jgi:hypothetical protein
MAREGVRLIVIQRQLGHSNLGITSRTRSGGRRVMGQGSCWVQGILRCAARGSEGGD